MECQICFAENCNSKYKCNKCKKIICYDCLEMYINTTSDFLKCSCTKYIFPSSIDSLPNIQKYKTFLIKRIEMNFFDDISSMREFSERAKNIREKRHQLMMKFPLCVQITIDNCFQKDLKHIKQKLEQKAVDFTKICHRTNCNGKIVQNICDKCTSKYCDFCLEMEQEGHQCKEEDILSKEYIKNMGISCPNCHLPIEKSSGCSYLTCAACDTKFEHTTNTISIHGGHSTKVEVNSSYRILNDIVKKYPLLSKIDVEKINKLESFELKYDKSMIKNLISNEQSKAIRYYERYLEEQRRYKENLKILEKIQKASSQEELLKYLQ